jgi:hypothetical protein
MSGGCCLSGPRGSKVPSRVRNPPWTAPFTASLRGCRSARCSGRHSSTPIVATDPPADVLTEAPPKSLHQRLSASFFLTDSARCPRTAHACAARMLRSWILFPPSRRERAPRGLPLPGPTKAPSRKKARERSKFTRKRRRLGYPRQTIVVRVRRSMDRGMDRGATSLTALRIRSALSCEARQTARIECPKARSSSNS